MEQERFNYDEFRKDWLNKHRLTLPKITWADRAFPVAGLVGGLILWTIILIATSVLSGAHSIPSVADTLPTGGENPMFDLEGARRVAALGFAMIEGTIFAAAMYKSASRYAKWALALSLIAGIMANESSSLHKINDLATSWPPTLKLALDLIVGAIIGFAAPMTAYFAGEMVGDLFRNFQATWKRLDLEIVARKKELEQRINAAWTKYENKLSGDNIVDERADEDTDAPTGGRLPSKKALELADLIMRDGNQELTISEIQKTYEVSGRGIAADARKIARGEW